MENKTTENDVKPADETEVTTLESEIKDEPIKSTEVEEESEEESEYDSEDEQIKKPKKKTTAPVKVVETPETPSEYSSENVHYEGSVAIHTDPKSGYQYQWDNDKNEWVAKTQTDHKYGYENDTHTYTDAEGAKYFWDKEKNAWFPLVDDEFLAQYQLNYGFIDNTTPDKVDKPAEPPKVKETEAKTGEKRKATVPSWFQVDDEQNNKVYVSNLPLDITEEEFVDLMQKYGLVMRDPQTQKMKIKLYTEKNNPEQLKGDALCTYIKIESVNLVLNLLDGYDLRGNKLKVERAKFEMKGKEYDPSLKPKKKKKKELDKIKRMQEKLFDWRPEKMIGERAKHEKVVIIHNLFEPSLFDKDVGLILEYQQDLREECTKCGEVKRVVIYDRHPEGVAQITMKEPEMADAVVVLLNNRWFGQRKITAEIWDGKTKYKIAETDSEISKRLDNWEKFVEGDEKGELKTENVDAKPENVEVKVDEGINIPTENI